MKFRPLHDRVVVRRVESEEKTAGGIIIPDTAKEKPSEGESLPSAMAPATKPAIWLRWKSRQATAYCSANGPAPKSRSTVKTC